LGNFKIYRSSAGSGKTFTLVKEYIKLCFRHKSNYRNILAVTFTNMATEEIRRKIITAFDELSGDRNLNLKNALMKDGIEEKTIKTKAKETLDLILHNYSDFSISTIDSFFHRVLRSFAKELRIPPGYKIQMDDKMVLKELILNLWHKTETDDELSDLIFRFIKHNIENGKGWRIENSLFRLGEEVFKDRYWEKKFLSGYNYENDKVNLSFITEKLISVVKKFSEDMKKSGEEGLEIIRKYNLSIEDFKSKSRGPANYFNKIINGNFVPSPAAGQAINNPDYWITKTAKNRNEIESCLNGGLLEAYKKSIEYYNNNKQDFNSAEKVLGNIFVLSIFKDLISMMKVYENEKNEILQSNISRILRLLISKENSPFIFDKIGSNYRHFLIDEFQDTSTFQWKNILPLIINSLSEKRFSMVVGDAKQSIYRWRNGNMRLILSDVYSDLNMFKEQFETINLDTNFRSAGAIVEFNNNFFSGISEYIEMKTDEGRNLLEKTFSSDVIQKCNSNINGFVSIKWIESELNKEDKMLASTEELKNIFKKLKFLINDSNSGEDKHRNEAVENIYDFKDVTILVRNNSEAALISNVLLKSGIPVISSDSLLLKSSPEVSVIIAAIKLIADKEDKISAVQLAGNLLKHIKDDTINLHKYFNKIKENTTYYLSEIAPEKFINRNGLFNSSFFSLDIYELTEILINTFGFDKKADLYLIKLLDTVREYTKDNPSDLSSFIEWWNENNGLISVNTPDTTDAVRIATMHKMKGLQNKVIIIPFAAFETGLRSTRDFIWVSSDKEPYNLQPAFPVIASGKLEDTYFSGDYNLEADMTLLDNLNLLYVAFTRSEEALFVISYTWKDENVGSIIKKQLEENTVFSNKFKNSQFTAGSLPNSPKTQKPITFQKYGFVSSQWQKRAVIRPLSQMIKPWEDNFDVITKGVTIHEILSKIKLKDDLDPVLEEYIASGEITVRKADEIRKYFSDILTNETIYEWFNGNFDVLTESEMVDSSKGILRPDRIMIKEKKAVILDYKTGKQKEPDLIQMKDYINTIKKLGYLNPEGYILYLQTPYKLLKI